MKSGELAVLANANFRVSNARLHEIGELGFVPLVLSLAATFSRGEMPPFSQRDLLCLVG
jgi:hypothetical protein